MKFVPDYYFEKFDDVTTDFLLSLGIKGIILDVDNTLEPYEHPFPGEHVIAWINSLKEVGIKAAIVSNNKGKRIELFNSSLNLPVFCSAKKPFKKNLLKAMKAMGTDVFSTITIGDQIFTDVWAAHNSGIKAILVPPIKDKLDPFTRFKRILEKPFLKKYRNDHKENN